MTRKINTNQLEVNEINSINQRQTHEEHLQRIKHANNFTKRKVKYNRDIYEILADMRKEILDTSV